MKVNNWATRSAEQDPKRIKGEWKLSSISEIGKDWYKCSVCGRKIHTIEKMLKEYPFCHCGADMQGEENEN